MVRENYPLYVDEVEYERWMKTKENPIKCDDGKLIWVNAKLELHRDNNLPAWISPAKDYEDYRMNGMLHRTNGPAIVHKDKKTKVIEEYCCFYHLFGQTRTKEEWEKETAKNIYFLREKIICLKKLTEIPELFQEVYYTHKNKFMELLRKID